MRKDRFAALAVIHSATGEISPDRHTQNSGRLKGAVGAPPHDAEFVSNLHHRRPDVVEELNFRYWLQASGSHTNGSPTMLASASGVLKTRSAPYFRCNPAVALKTPPFLLLRANFLRGWRRRHLRQKR